MEKFPVINNNKMAANQSICYVILMDEGYSESNNSMGTVWKVVNSLHESNSFDVGRYAVLVLNQPISIPPKVLVSLWDEACFRATADGGTDRWYEFVSSLSEGSGLKKLHPDLTSGDFDSIKMETLKLCQENGVTVVDTPDQDKTDFHKALEEMAKQTSGRIDSIFAVVENCGRLDHIMSNMNTLYHARSIFNVPAVDVYLLSSQCLTWLLREGSHSIRISQGLVEAQASCGLIPLGTDCTVTTTGLKWNLNGEVMKFGGLISTSNTYDERCGREVTVETDSPLIWTMNLNL